VDGEEVEFRGKNSGSYEIQPNRGTKNHRGRGSQAKRKSTQKPHVTASEKLGREVSKILKADSAVQGQKVGPPNQPNKAFTGKTKKALHKTGSSTP